MLHRANRQKEHRAQVPILPNAAVVYAVAQHVEQTFEYLRSEDRISLSSENVMVALASVGQLMGLAEGDIERILDMPQKEPSLAMTGMSYSEFVDSVRCLAVLHGHLALEALPALQVPDLSRALYTTYMLYSKAQRPHPSGAVCRCRHVAGELPPRLFREGFLRLCRDAGFVQPEGPLPLSSLDRIWLGCSGTCDHQLPEHMCFAQFLRTLAVVSGQIKAEVFVPVAALGLAQEIPTLKLVPTSYRLKHYKEVPLNLGGHWSLPHLTFEALAKAVREGRQYEYGQFLRDAQETALRDEAQRQQLRGLPINSSGNGGRARPLSAGLTVLSPHPRRPGAGADDWAGSGAKGRGLAAAAGAGAGAAAGPSLHSSNLSGGSFAGGGSASSVLPPGSRPPDAHNGWFGSEDPAPHPPATQLSPWGRDGLPFPTSRPLERSRSTVGLALPPPLPSGGSLPGVEGGGRVCMDSARPRALHSSTSFSSNTSPRTSFIAAQGALGGAAGGAVSAGAPDGARPAVARALSRRNVSNGDGPMGAAGAGGGGGGSVTSLISPRGGVGGNGNGWVNGTDAAASMAVEYCAAGVRELRRDVEGRLDVLEDQGRQVMALLVQLQSQMAALQQPTPQPQLPQQQEEPWEEVSAVLHGGPGGALHTQAGEGPAAGYRTPPWSPPRSRSPSRPSSAKEDGRDTARYGVVVRTSDLPGAGTDADVFLTIYGDKGDTGERLLSNGACNFERGRVSTFVFTAADVGEVHTVRVRLRTHSALALVLPSPTFTPAPVSSPSWHLDAIQVASSATGTRYHFPHCGWVDNVLGRECVLHCKGTAPDTDKDPPGWRPPPPRAPGVVGAASAAAAGATSPPPQSPPRSPSPPPLQQQQQQQPQAAWDTDREEELSCCPTLTPHGTEVVRQALSPLSSPELLSPPSDAASSPVAPPGFTPGVAHDPVVLDKQQQQQQLLDGELASAADSPAPDTAVAAAASGDTLVPAESGDDGSPAAVVAAAAAAAVAAAAAAAAAVSGGSGDDESSSAAAAVAPPDSVRRLEERLEELQRRVQLVEGAQADTAMRAAAAVAAAVLVRVPAPLLAAVRRPAAGETHSADNGTGGGAAASTASVTAAGGGGSDSEDSSLMLLADMLTHVHTLAEQGVAAASTADAQAAAALDTSRRQQSRLAQLQFEISATSQAAEHAAIRATRASEQVEEFLQNQKKEMEQKQKEQLGRPVGAGGFGAAFGLGDGFAMAAMSDAVRVCNLQLGALNDTVKQVTTEQAAAAKAALAQVEALRVDTQAYQAHLAKSLADIAASLAAQREAREAGCQPVLLDLGAAAAEEGDDGGGAGTGGEGAEASSLRTALASLRREILQLARAVATGGGVGAGADVGADVSAIEGTRADTGAGAETGVGGDAAAVAGGDAGGGTSLRGWAHSARGSGSGDGIAPEASRDSGSAIGGVDRNGLRDSGSSMPQPGTSGNLALPADSGAQGSVSVVNNSVRSLGSYTSTLTGLDSKCASGD